MFCNFQAIQFKLNIRANLRQGGLTLAFLYLHPRAKVINDDRCVDEL